jgi:hypothetical protein
MKPFDTGTLKALTSIATPEDIAALKRAIDEGRHGHQFWLLPLFSMLVQRLRRRGPAPDAQNEPERHQNAS